MMVRLLEEKRRGLERKVVKGVGWVDWLQAWRRRERDDADADADSEEGGGGRG